MEQEKASMSAQEYGEFIDLLNKLRRTNRISAEQWRNYRKQWNANPQDRQLLLDQLKLK